MKYTSILILMILSLLLTSCFQKPADTDDGTGDTDTPTIEQEDTQDTEDDTMTGTGEEDMGEDTEDGETSVEASGSVSLDDGEEEVVIEEIEAELEELFSDLLGENEEK